MGRGELRPRPFVPHLRATQSSEELGELFARLGYPLGYDSIPKNVA